MRDINYWIIKFRDTAKRKNAKPVNTMFFHGDYRILDVVEEALEVCRKSEELTSILIEVRLMTPAEIKKWDDDVDRGARREEREAMKSWTKEERRRWAKEQQS